MIFVTLGYFWLETGSTNENDQYYIVLLFVLTFGLSVGGFFAGIVERKYGVKRTLIGFLGNSVLTIIFLVVFVLSIIYGNV